MCWWLLQLRTGRVTVPTAGHGGESSAGVNLDRGGWAARNEEGR